jgi:molecular chaperone GrpE
MMLKNNDEDQRFERGDEATGAEAEIEQEIEEADHDIEQIESDLEKARREAGGYLDSLQRLKAEFDNFRKRVQKERTEFLKLAAQGVIGDLLPVMDNFERALAHEIHGDQVEKFKDGLQLVYSQMLDVLAKEGLSALEPVGEPFDPTRHEALMQVESEEYSEGVIVKVLEKGYVLNDRVIRPAKVMVSKGEG